MKKTLFAMLLLAGVAAMTVSAAFSQEQAGNENFLRPFSRLRLAEKAQALGTSAITYDTTYMGYSATHAPVAGNWWNVFASSVRRPGTGDPANTIWDFEDFSKAHGDSMLGWWPLNNRQAPRAGMVDDHIYPYACMDFGNGINTKIPGPSQRTLGIIGAWHSDPGKNAGIGVTWTPMSGTKSAWCGLRQHNDPSVIDQVTGNPYNATCASFLLLNSAPTAKNFPGYVQYWDQMMYRDITPVAGQDLSLSFLYRTYMSTAFTATSSGRPGWFHGDPLSMVAGNFISAAAQNGPIDSFSVYIGVPVDDANVTLSTGAVAPVYDTQRRWFSEVLRIWDGPTAPYFEILSKTGKNPVAPDTSGANLFAAVIPWTPVLAGDPNIRDISTSPFNTSGGKVRLVFRVKTNNTGDDLTSSTWGELGGRGAAQVDDVTIQWGAGATTVIGAFEGAEGAAGEVNNAIGTSSATYWKTTGRPPAMYLHVRPIAGLTWLDLCGPVGAGTRRCDMQGNVIDTGNEPTGTIGDPSYEAGKNGRYTLISPTMNLASTGTSLKNNQDLDSTKAGASDDYYVSYDVYTGASLGPANGVLWQFGCVSYPNLTVGTKSECWGDVCAPFLYYDTGNFCYPDQSALKINGLVFTSKSTGKPDSMKIVLSCYNYPLRWTVGVGANPTDGLYFDNACLAIVNKGGTVNRVGAIGRDIWQQMADAFPAAKTVTLGPGTFASSLDTCGAMMKSAINIAPVSIGGGPRVDVLGDSIIIQAPDLSAAAGDTNSLKVRVDMVFRILPGPGNYRNNVGDVAPKYPPVAGMALLRRPDIRNATAACLVNKSDLTDNSFWANYIRTPGQFSSPSPHPGGVWSHLTWNSARLDSQETNFFFTLNRNAPRAEVFQTTLHESDPHYATLGITRPRCFQIDTLLTTDFSPGNVVCGSAPAYLFPVIPGTTPPPSRTGWDGTVTTIEETKVIPDGLLTPGSHVQFFFRKGQVFGAFGYAMDPDTSTIAPQASEGSNEGHRWQQISVLPDRYKDTQFGGAGMACMLMLDYADRYSAERAWVGAMDSTSGTAAIKWGTHNGWHAAGNGHSLDSEVNPNLQAEAFVYKNAQPGTLWDLYQPRAVESGACGTRVGARLVAPAVGLLAGQDAATAPTPLMLKQFYSSLVLLAPPLNAKILGPFLDIPEDDLLMLSDFLNDAGGLKGKPRSLFIAGEGFASAESGLPAHATFLSDQLRVNLVNPDYVALSSNTSACSDIISTSVISATDIFGTALACTFQTDVIAANTVVPGASNVSQYTNTGAGPYYAAVYHAPDALNPDENYISLVDAFSFQRLWGRYCATSFGRVGYVLDMKTKIFASVCSAWSGSVGIDVPTMPAGIANYMRIGNSVMRSGNATVNFGVATTGRVRVRLYDVTGRLVRTLADRTFPGGQAQTVKWDGRDNSGNQSARGVYFARIDYASGAAINGRVVVLQ